MYQLFTETDNSFAPDLVGEYNTIEEAREVAKKCKEEHSDLYYEIKETDGHVNSYGELIAMVVEKG